MQRAGSQTEGPPRRAAIVGAGVGGLAAAMLLARAGFRTTVLEAADRPGGKLRELTVGGLAVDSGPTVLTMRPVFDALFAASGCRLDESVHLRPAPIVARHSWEDGSILDLGDDRSMNVRAIAAFAGQAEADGYLRFCDRAAAIFATLERPFILEPQPGVPSLVRAHGLTGLPALARIGAFSTLWTLIGGYLRDARLRQLFARYATYCGSSPFLAAGPLALVAHVEQQGVWLVEGGMGRLADAMVAVAVASGAEIRCRAPVVGILCDQGRACGVRLADGTHEKADLVVFNGDPVALAGGLLGDGARSAVDSWAASERSLSALTLSMSGRASGFDLAHHNVFFSHDYRGEFDAIASGRLPEEPTVYLCAQDRGGDKAPPHAQERFFTIVNAPATADSRPAGNGEIDRCIEATLDRMRRAGLTLAIDDIRRTTPTDFAALFPATGGALYGRSSHGWNASFRRPTARSRVHGLYLAGGACHPGPGLPMAALSGWQAAIAVCRDFASTETSQLVAMPGGMSTL